MRAPIDITTDLARYLAIMKPDSVRYAHPKGYG